MPGWQSPRAGNVLERPQGRREGPSRARPDRGRSPGRIGRRVATVSRLNPGGRREGHSLPPQHEARPAPRPPRNRHAATQRCDPACIHFLWAPPAGSRPQPPPSLPSARPSLRAERAGTAGRPRDGCQASGPRLAKRRALCHEGQHPAPSLRRGTQACSLGEPRLEA